ncbi:DUF3592 domain-containing protein [Actinosynnema sp. NPDC049800]
MNTALKVIAALGGLVLGVVYVATELTTVSVDAEVVRVEHSKATHPPWRPVVRFTTADGRSVTATLPKEGEARRPGDLVAIRYHPRDPTRADYDDDRVTSIAFTFLVGLAVVSTVNSVFRDLAAERRARRSRLGPGGGRTWSSAEPGHRRPGGLPEQFL